MGQWRRERAPDQFCYHPGATYQPRRNAGDHTGELYIATVKKSGRAQRRFRKGLALRSRKNVRENHPNEAPSDLSPCNLFACDGGEIDPTGDLDETLSPSDYRTALLWWQTRYGTMWAALQEGKIVRVVQSCNSWSLYPKGFVNDQCTFAPVKGHDDVQEDDIVLCKEQPGDRFYIEKVKEKKPYYNAKESGVPYFMMSGQDGEEYGWCGPKHICGRLVDVRH